MERTAACQLSFSIDFAFHFGESATARTRALSRAIHQCDNAVFGTWWNVVVAATGCLIKLKRNGQIANCRLKGIWNSFVSATGCMPIIGHLVAPPSTLSGPWHSSRSSNSNINNIIRNNNISINNAASPSAASFASIIGTKKLHKALWQYVGYIKISHTHAHTHTHAYTHILDIWERMIGAVKALRHWPQNRKEDAHKASGEKGHSGWRRISMNWLAANWWITQHDCQTETQMKPSAWWAAPTIGPHTDWARLGSLGNRVGRARAAS